ncbi:SET domain containing [Seminavis robusta]|uniref:SET domain containing n=1 Tax=Seminavis robusta TaxID=568900 RepID=A0A9N8HFE5_9STRA|nr:SET domain containing [Seminavis robusta]|eukprot:Sro451_g145760.1 SET domain containing (480) ;mRNA; f:56198-57637
MEGLLDWAESNGIYFSDDIELGKDETGSIGVSWKNNTDRSTQNSNDEDEGYTTLLEIPIESVLMSSMLDSSLQQKVEEACHLKKLQDQEEQSPPIPGSDSPEDLVEDFTLVLLVLQELSKGRESKWYKWFQTLPTTFQTPMYWDPVEREYANQLGLKFGIQQADKIWEDLLFVLRTALPSHTYSPSTIQWAYSIYTTRCMSIQTHNGQEVTCLLCVGDMFNHRSSGTTVEFPHQESPDGPVLIKISNQDAATNSTAKSQGIYMNYGYRFQPARFLCSYGFFDASSPDWTAIPAMPLVISSRDNAQEAAGLGFFSHEEMIFDTNTGRASPHVWNAILWDYLQRQLYKLQTGYAMPTQFSWNDCLICGHQVYLSQGPQKRKHGGDDASSSIAQIQESLQHLKKSDDHTSQVLLGRHHRELTQVLLRVVENVLDTIGPVPEEKSQEFCYKHPNWKLLHDFHQNFESVYLKVQEYLTMEMANY